MGPSRGKSGHPGGPGFAWLKVFHLCSLLRPWKSLPRPQVTAHGEEPTLWGDAVTLSQAVLKCVFFLSGLFRFGWHTPASCSQRPRQVLQTCDANWVTALLGGQLL